ncbi:MAG: LysM peptidoglycan-binding domain-containing protein [Kiritimatiellia bacterium]
MNKTLMLGVMMATTVWVAGAEPPPSAGSGRDSFIRNQAYAEMQRVSGQIDVLQNNLDALERRVGAMEGGKGELGGIRRDVEALRADIASVRREMANLRTEITADLTRKIQTVMKSVRMTPPPAAATAEPVVPQNCKKYRVESGDTLSLIAQAFKTTVHRIKELNHLKSDHLRIGQELLVPAPPR